jgi:hypothetical protein
MAKMLTFMMVTTGLVLLMGISGLATPSSFILNFLGLGLNNVENFQSTTLYVGLLAAIGSLITVTGIKIGFISAPTETTWAAAVFALPMAIFVGDFVSIIVQSYSAGETWASVLLGLILIPYIVGYCITLFDWVRGMDN